MNNSFTNRLFFGIGGVVAMLLGWWIIRGMNYESKHALPSKLTGIPYTMCILGLLAVLYAVFGLSKKTDEKTTNKNP